MLYSSMAKGDHHRPQVTSPQITSSHFPSIKKLPQMFLPDRAISDGTNISVHCMHSPF